MKSIENGDSSSALEEVETIEKLHVVAVKEDREKVDNALLNSLQLKNEEQEIDEDEPPPLPVSPPPLGS